MFKLNAKETKLINGYIKRKDELKGAVKDISSLIKDRWPWLPKPDTTEGPVWYGELTDVAPKLPFSKRVRGSSVSSVYFRCNVNLPAADIECIRKQTIEFIKYTINPKVELPKRASAVGIPHGLSQDTFWERFDNLSFTLDELMSIFTPILIEKDNIDPKRLVELITKVPTLMEYVQSDKLDTEVATKLVKAYGKLIKYISNPTQEQIEIALESDINNIIHLPSTTWKMIKRFISRPEANLSLVNEIGVNKNNYKVLKRWNKELPYYVIGSDDSDVRKCIDDIPYIMHRDTEREISVELIEYAIRKDHTLLMYYDDLPSASLLKLLESGLHFLPYTSSILKKCSVEEVAKVFVKKLGTEEYEDYLEKMRSHDDIKEAVLRLAKAEDIWHLLNKEEKESLILRVGVDYNLIEKDLDFDEYNIQEFASIGKLFNYSSKSVEIPEVFI